MDHDYDIEVMASLKAVGAAGHHGLGTRPHTKERFSITSFGLLCLCLWAWRHRMVEANQEAGRYVLDGLLHTVLPGLAYSDLHMAEMHQDYQGRCDHGHGCNHLQTTLDKVSKAEEQDKLITWLGWSTSLAPVCKTLKAMLEESLSALANAIAEEWPKRNFPSDPVRDGLVLHAAKKRRLVDQDLKKQLIQRSVGHKISPATGAAFAMGEEAPGGMQRWQAQTCAQYLSAMWKAFIPQEPEALVLSIAYDASRMGSPQEETVIYAVTDGDVAGWLPPMVHQVTQSTPHLLCQMKTHGLQDLVYLK